ncbi:MAG: 8-amino-7-oxononanoate synthase [Verrucomicrobiota bacterium]
MSRPFEEELDALKQQSLLRRLREIESQPGTAMTYAGRRLINFSSNDYLGLAGEPFLRDAAKEAIDVYGIGATASRLVCGTLSPHVALEEKLAAFKRAEAALCFSSGYATALGTLGALAGKGDVIILDKLAHASLIDGARLSGAVLRVFPHNQVDKLEDHLQWARKEHADARVIVVTESVFSMDGDRAPLAELVEVKDRYGALLLLDEAHAVGVVGPNGRGLAERLGLSDRVDVQMGTLSKALGVSGGYVCGRRALIDWLINRARSFVYSTAPPPALAAAACAAVEFLESPAGEARRRRLWNNLKVLAAGLPPGLTPDKLQSAIVPVMLGDEAAALKASKMFYDSGFFIPAIRYPTVARGTARLRLTLSAAHYPEEIQAVTEALWELE